MAERDDLFYRLALCFIRGLDARVVQALLAAAGSFEALFTGWPIDDREIPGVLKRNFSGKFRDEALSRAETEYAFVQKNHISVLFYTDDAYPARLRECEDAPLFLFAKGGGSLNAGRVVSVVGTRHATAYGRDFSQSFIRELSEIFPDVLIVSGLAYGIDIAAHRAALDAGVATFGVLAHGLQMVYPETHRNTAISMLPAGGLITEYTSQQPVHKGNFVARNRIIAGVSDATIVVESAEKGGALITAELAGSYHRDVFALPGRIQDLYSRGCNRLIASNRAGLIGSASDFIRQMCWELPHKEGPVQTSLFPALELSDDEVCVMRVLDAEGESHINLLTAQCGLPASRLLAVLLDLEFKNLVRPFPGGVYRRKG